MAVCGHRAGRRMFACGAAFRAQRFRWRRPWQPAAARGFDGISRRRAGGCPPPRRSAVLARTCPSQAPPRVGSVSARALVPARSRPFVGRRAALEMSCPVFGGSSSCGIRIPLRIGGSHARCYLRRAYSSSQSVPSLRSLTRMPAAASPSRMRSEAAQSLAARAFRRSASSISTSGVT